MAVIELDSSPSVLGVYGRAVLSALPVVGAKGDTLPDDTLVLRGLRVDSDNLAEYTKVCGLTFGDTLPLTYPFMLTFPVVMKLMVSKGFPFAAVGSVHAENVIEQYRPISVTEPLDVRVHAENMREHRKGLLVDVVSEVAVGREPVWRQTSTFLHQQRTSLSGQPRQDPPEVEIPPVPTSTLRVDQKVISRYAAVSGDRNPIHVSTLGAKAFGFPKTIAHGMWSAAAALRAVEGKVPGAVTYAVKFGKPVLLPATVNLYARRDADGWDIALRHPKKLYPHLTATLR
ncbi:MULTISPECIES: MaoC/PaaZ C-terminal domain-containing protein [unclassified Rhodococcus (in: high G+C Gram-positive bacteria)]|uniref:MaoC family dehydratase n=1 Tax=unclassified Rhodococcus (in: high G+C Gram-positive bacteria) TaxID=192944 RepID=UPI00146AAF83|nr:MULTISPECIES: MaoC/PaaZ C-terminal domain-containing protein [unclassified Rhodococcus (in: high G+C Gram-positive bacteria)]NMD96862.1 dehydratase [Rhodococcus sp. BL-253-APC-6A1W]NME77996.1 dehydratase [Rhodococcus sp. 105337]